MNHIIYITLGFSIILFLFSKKGTTPRFIAQSLLLLELAIFLAIFLIPLAFIINVIYSLIKKDNLDKHFYNLAYSIDQTANASGPNFWQLILVNKYAPYKFGNPDDTLSYALAMNMGYETIIGHILVLILETVDPGHMEKSLKI